MNGKMDFNFIGLPIFQTMQRRRFSHRPSKRRASATMAKVG
jgi:hypothetical protein